MKRFHRPLFALLLSLLLLGSQQAALAHLIGHIGGAAETVAQHEDNGHGAALSLSHVCTTCIAFAALDGPPASPEVPLLAAAQGEHFRSTVISFFRARSVLVRRARGPPKHSLP